MVKYILVVTKKFLPWNLFFICRVHKLDGHLRWPSPRNRSIWWFPYHRLVTRYCAWPHAPPAHHQEETRRVLWETKGGAWRLVRMGVCAACRMCCRYVTMSNKKCFQKKMPLVKHDNFYCADWFLFYSSIAKKIFFKSLKHKTSVTRFSFMICRGGYFSFF